MSDVSAASKKLIKINRNRLGYGPQLAAPRETTAQLAAPRETTEK